MQVDPDVNLFVHSGNAFLTSYVEHNGKANILVNFGITNDLDPSNDLDWCKQQTSIKSIWENENMFLQSFAPLRPPPSINFEFKQDEEYKLEIHKGFDENLTPYIYKTNGVFQVSYMPFEKFEYDAIVHLRDNNSMQIDDSVKIYLLLRLKRYIYVEQNKITYQGELTKSTSNDTYYNKNATKEFVLANNVRLSLMRGEAVSIRKEKLFTKEERKINYKNYLEKM